MKLKIVVLLLGLVTYTTAIAQYTEVGYPLAYGSFNGGFSLPLGGFSSTSHNDWTGYAKGGSTFSIQVGIPFKRSNFGVALLVGYDKNGYNTDTYQQNLAKSDTSRTYSTITSISYSQYYLMGGLLVTSNSVNGLSFNGRALLGIMYVNYPDPYWTSTDINGGIMENWYLNTTPTTTLGFDIGGGAVYTANNGFTALVSIDFIHSGATYTTNQLIDNGSTQISTNYTNAISISALNFTVGVGYSF